MLPPSTLAAKTMMIPCIIGVRNLMVLILVYAFRDSFSDYTRR